MKVEDCPNYENCGASMCPLDKPEKYIFYPDDEICKKHHSKWIKNQKKIAKKAKDVNKYFTYEMLKTNCVIGNGIMGLDPDKPEEPQLKKWFESHPPKKELTNLQKRVIANRFAEYRKKLKK